MKPLWSRCESPARKDPSSAARRRRAAPPTAWRSRPGRRWRAHCAPLRRTAVACRAHRGTCRGLRQRGLSRVRPTRSRGRCARRSRGEMRRRPHRSSAAPPARASPARRPPRPRRCRRARESKVPPRRPAGWRRPPRPAGRGGGDGETTTAAAAPGLPARAFRAAPRAPQALRPAWIRPPRVRPARGGAGRCGGGCRLSGRRRRVSRGCGRHGGRHGGRQPQGDSSQRRAVPGRPAGVLRQRAHVRWYEIRCARRSDRGERRSLPPR